MPNFTDFFDNKIGPRNLSIEFLKAHNYGAKNVFDGLILSDLMYFDKIINEGNNKNYKLYAEYKVPKNNDFIFHNLKDLYEKFTTFGGADRIIEFLGREIYIHMLEADSYIIFGRKDILNIISEYDYSDEYAKKILNETNSEDIREVFQWLYDTYQHL